MLSPWYGMTVNKISNLIDIEHQQTVLRYNYTYLDQLHILPVNSTRRVLQKMSLHPHPILSASTRKNTLKYRSHCCYSDHRKNILASTLHHRQKHRIAKYRSRKHKRKVNK